MRGRLSRLRASCWPVLAREWDRLLIAALFILFGFLDAVRPHHSPLAAFLEPFWVAQFIAAGALLAIGVVRKSYVLRGLGTVLYATGLASIAAVVVFGSGAGSSTLPLMAAFAVQGLADLRRLRVDNEREAVMDEVDHARRARRGCPWPG